MRLCMAADQAVSTIQWAGRPVDVRSDAWIVHLSVPKAAAAVPFSAASGGPGWTSRDLGEGFYSLETPGAAPKQVLDWAGSYGGIASIEPDFAIATRSIPNDPSFGQLWGLNNTGQSGGTVDADIDAPEAWNVTTGSRNVVVAVIDTGIDYTHRDLAANAWRNPGEIPGDGIDNDRNGFVDDVYGWDFANGDADPMDDEGHGTHVSGTIGAVGNNGTGVAGVAWQVSIMGLKFMDSSGSGYTSDAVAAINYATKMRRDFGINIVAANNSWGGGGLSTSLRTAIDNAGQAGILFVAAAGNESNNNDANPSYPSSAPGNSVIAVAATDRNNRLASFSNYGATSVDIAAPGVAIYSTTPNNTYATYSGTSMATPHVTGVVALLAAAAPRATASQIRSAILSSATPVAGLSGKVATGGLLNAAAALAAITGVPIDPGPVDPPPPPTVDPTEPNDTLSQATTVTLVGGSGTTGGTIGNGSYAPSDVDLYSILLSAGTTVVIDLDARTLSSPSPLDSYLRVFDAAGREVAANDDQSTSQLDSYLSFKATASGVYYVGVSAYGNTTYDPLVGGSGVPTDTSGDYVLKFTATVPVSPPPAIPDAGDTMATATAVDVSASKLVRSGQIGDGRNGAKDVDMYRVTLRAGQRLAIDIDARSLAPSSTLDSVVRVFAASGRAVAMNDDYGGWYDSYLVFKATTTGTYYVGVSGYGNAAYNPARAGSGKNGSTGGYQVAFSLLQSPTAQPAGRMGIMGFPDDPQPQAQRPAVKRWTMTWW